MEAARNTLQEKSAHREQGNTPAIPGCFENGQPILVEPDSDFVRRIGRRSGDAFMKCMQCGTCSATCSLSSDVNPFPRKDLAWARWGMKDRLLRDSDIWLCYQCNDCSARCPRSARPGEVLAAIRQECIVNFSAPSFFGRWMQRPQFIPLLLGIPVALLALALLLVGPIEDALGITRSLDGQILFTYSSMFPHWMLNSFFAFFSLLTLIVVISGILRFWRAMKSTIPRERYVNPARGLGASILSTLKTVFIHDNFDQCTIARPRYVSHLCVFFGFLALAAVSLWVITAKINPMVRGDFIYPFGFLSPWKILANLGGIALLTGLVLMMWDRFRNDELVGPGSYFDWSLIATLSMVVVTGFMTEALHYLRLEPHRHLAYFVHLVFAFTVLIYLPYSKLAHLVYRTTALVFAEYTGRTSVGGVNGDNLLQRDTIDAEEQTKAVAK